MQAYYMLTHNHKDQLLSFVKTAINCALVSKCMVETMKHYSSSYSFYYAASNAGKI